MTVDFNRQELLELMNTLPMSHWAQDRLLVALNEVSGASRTASIPTPQPRVQAPINTPRVTRLSFR